MDAIRLGQSDIYKTFQAANLHGCGFRIQKNENCDILINLFGISKYLKPKHTKITKYALITIEIGDGLSAAKV